MKIFIRSSEEKKFEKAIARKVSTIMDAALDEIADDLFKEAEKLAKEVQKFIDSQAFKLIGEFGFTPEEVISKLNKVETLLIPDGGSITTLDRKKGRTQHAILNWVDIDALKESDLAQHDLTRWNPAVRRFVRTETISWIEWLEEGKVITGWTFDPGRTASPPSRSGEGLMVKDGLWRFEPTFIFEKTAKGFKPAELEKQFRIIVKKKA